MSNPLVNVLTPKTRQVVYVVAMLGTLGWGAYEAAGEDWRQAVPLFLGSLVSATAAANASHTPVEGKHVAQDGNVDVLLLLSVLTFVGVLLLLFRVHF